LDLGNRGSMQRERALDAHALADLADREARPHTAAADVDHLAAELLLPLLVAFDDADRNLDGVAGAKLRTIGLELSGLDLFDQAHTKTPFSPRHPTIPEALWRRRSIGESLDRSQIGGRNPSGAGDGDHVPVQDLARAEGS